MTGAKAKGGFSPTAMIVIVLVGVVTLAGLGVLSAYAPELRSGDDGGGHALSKSSIGYGGLPPLLRSLGAPVVLSRGALRSTDESLLVLTPEVQTSPDLLVDIDHAGATLIILPKWIGIKEPGRQGWVRTAGTHAPQAALRPLPEQVREDATLNQQTGRRTVVLRRPNGAAVGAPVEIENLRTLSGENWIPVVLDDRGEAVLVMHRQTRDYVLSDPDLVNTAALKTLNGARTATALVGLIRAEGSPIVFDLTLHGFQRTRSLLRLMLEPPLLGLTLVMAALAVFIGFQCVTRFGPAHERARVIALGKRGLADNTAGLVRLARREPHMATPYARLVRARVARAVGAPRGLEDADLDAFLDRVSRSTGATSTYTELARKAGSAATAADLMQVAAALHRWNQELTRGRQ